MLGKDLSKIKSEEAETIIGEGVKVEGTFSAFGNIVIKGELIGTLETENDLLIKEKGKVEANITSKNAFVAGEIKGNLEATEKIELASTAKVLGDINCRILAIEEGAILNGRCKVGENFSGNTKKKEVKEKEIKDKEDIE